PMVSHRECLRRGGGGGPGAHPGGGPGAQPGGGGPQPGGGGGGDVTTASSLSRRSARWAR
ncbi:MAG: hypothetical protein LC708_03650, partial [Actinobacteria bacterium]|nr:hypothetical protein [Actinomycetota bacterium]